MKHYFFIFVTSLIIFTGCTKTITLDLRESDSVLSINGSVSAFSSPLGSLSIANGVDLFNFVSITKSVKIGEEVDISKGDNIVKTAEVIIYTLAKDTFRLTYKNGQYTDQNLKGKPGVTYYLRVRYDGKEYTSSSTLPMTPPVIKEMYATEKPSGFADIRNEFRIDAEITDDPNTKDYYFYLANYIGENNLSILELDRRVRNDQFFNGNDYRQRVLDIEENDFPSLPNPEEITAIVAISKITKVVYDYYFILLRLTSEDRFGGPIIAPGNPKTNISGENVTGVFSAGNVAIKTKVVKKQ